MNVYRSNILKRSCIAVAEMKLVSAQISCGFKHTCI